MHVRLPVTPTPARSAARLGIVFVGAAFVLAGCESVSQYQDATSKNCPGCQTDQQIRAERDRQRALSASNSNLNRQEGQLNQQLSANEAAIANAQAALSDADRAASDALKRLRLSQAQREKLQSQQSQLRAEMNQLKSQQAFAGKAAAGPVDAAKEKQYQQMVEHAKQVQKSISDLEAAAAKGAS